MKIVVISPNRKQVEELLPILQQENVARKVQLFEGGAEKLGAVADQEQPNLMVVESESDGREVVDALESVSRTHPAMSFILLCKQVSAENVIHAMRIGVRDVLQFPVSPQALQDSVARIEKSLAHPEMPKHKGKVLAFLACKGGSGATFLATNMAFALASEFNKRVIVIDLNMQFGDASLFVSEQAPDYTLTNVAHEISRLDASLLSSYLMKAKPNLGILAAPENPARAMEVQPSHIDALLRLAVAEYDYVVLDVGRNMDGITVKALDHADMIFPVLQETLPFIRDAKRMLATLMSLDYSMDKIHLILNRYEKGGDVQLVDVERTLNTPVNVIIPNSFRTVSASVNQGVPILELDKKDPVSKSLVKFAHDLEQDEAPERSWFANLFGGRK